MLLRLHTVSSAQHSYVRPVEQPGKIGNTHGSTERACKPERIQIGVRCPHGALIHKWCHAFLFISCTRANSYQDLSFLHDTHTHTHAHNTHTHTHTEAIWFPKTFRLATIRIHLFRSPRHSSHQQVLKRNKIHSELVCGLYEGAGVMSTT